MCIEILKAWSEAFWKWLNLKVQNTLNWETCLPPSSTVVPILVLKMYYDALLSGQYMYIAKAVILPLHHHQEVFILQNTYDDIIVLPQNQQSVHWDAIASNITI